MKSPDLYPSFDEVSDAIGDKVLSAMFKAVTQTRADLAEYRAVAPHFVAGHSERGLANWIHDRLWVNAVTDLTDVSEVTLSDNGVTREIICGTEFRFRAKRHDENAGVQSYPTQTALEFHIQAPTFDDLSELKLDFGYTWDAELRDVGPAVMSLRHENELVWFELISGEEQAGTATHSVGPAPVSGPGVSIDVATQKQKEAEAQ